MTARMIPAPGMIAQAACLLEATARKPGNVHRFADFDDVTYLDFALSAGVIAEAINRAAKQPLGATIWQAVAATRAIVSTNTNLGLILLLAPLAAVSPGEPLREGVAAVLDATTVDDARQVYQAIRLAQPGGLGVSPEGQDVHDEPTISLVKTMRLASARDLVARQYATGFADLFDCFVPTLADELARPGRSLEAAIVRAYLVFLADHPDTLIARKRGDVVAREVSARAAGVLAEGWPDTAASTAVAEEFDAWLRADGHARNPGATADLVGAGLFVAIRNAIIAWPISARWATGPIRS